MIQSLERALRVLEALKEINRDFSIAQLSENLQLPPSTLHRILETLCKYKYVVKDERAHTYKLGSAVIPLGIVAKNNLRLQDNVLPILKSLSSITHEDSFFIISSGYKGLILEKSEGSSPFKVVDPLGYERYLHCGATRKVLLAFQTDEFVDDYIKNALPEDTSEPKITSQKLYQDIVKIRTDGVSVSFGDYIEGSVGIGAPVYGSDGKIKASIGIIFPDSRINNEAHMEKLKKTVKKHAAELSSTMGYSSPLAHLR
ncbi:MAG: IclR family transcriptional regulator [Proteocatella sp.]